MTRLVLLVALATISAQAFEVSNTSFATRDFNKTPFQNDIAFRFFEVAAEDTTTESGSPFNTAPHNYELCKTEAALIVRAMNNYEEWGLQFPDAWGRMPMGIFWGHQISMGNYEECVEYRRSPKGSTEEIRGQYCLAKIPVKKTFEKIKPWNYTGDSRVTYMLTATEFFELGMCMPKSCSPQQSDKYLKQIFHETFGFDYDEKSEAMVRDGKWCDYEKPIELRGIDIFAIVFFSLIVLFMILSAIYDLQMQKTGQTGHPLLLAFSPITNSRKLFKVNDNSKNPNVIECMNGIRCFSMMWVIFGHGYMTFYDLPHINRNKFFTWTETPYSMLVQNATLCVDSFFFMSGLLMLWGAFREMEKTKGKLNLGMMYFHRYIRLTPVVAVVILYIMSLYKYSGSGPMWMKVGNQDEKCADTWWATLIYVQNYVFPYGMCMSQSWYLAVDTQLYVLSPLFLIPLWKWGKKALWPIIGVLILGLAGTFATYMINDFTLFRVQDNNVGKRQALTYYPTHTRLASWLIGVIFGYFFFKYNRGKRIPLAKHWVILGWTVAFGTMLACLWGPYWRILPDTPNAPIIEGAFYEPLSRSSWAISVGWIIWACYNGHGGLINDFLSWGFFQAFARLSYCMYVIHRIVQWVTAGRIQTDTHFSDWDYILRWWHEFGITLCAAYIASLAFEAPILGIEKAIFGHGKPAPKPKTESKEGLTDVTTVEPTTSTTQ